ncbi:UNVERIFIED_CONTAM: hypothetical protein Slati_2926200 [Sesamum latifolium]|uniref:Uncharacterized protein n=1 Tax=Sesamum latifolium TaxID=2727402 RepID=A0AAW2VEX3_9LAMI
MVRGRVLLMPVLVHIIMAVAPMLMCTGLADRFHDVLHAAEQPLWNGCTTSQLAVVAELVDIKKLIKDLGLPMEKIDAFKNDCMLYWKDDIDLDYCKFCGEARYKPTRERNPNRKKIPYAVLRYLPIPLAYRGCMLHK